MNDPPNPIDASLTRYINSIVRHADTTPSLTPSSIPSIVEVFFDGILALRWNDGVRTFEASPPDDYSPTLIEIVFDGNPVYIHDGHRQILPR